MITVKASKKSSCARELLTLRAFGLGIASASMIMHRSAFANFLLLKEQI